MAKRLSDSIVTSNGNGAKPQPSAQDDFPQPMEEPIFVRLGTGRIVEMVIGELSMFYELGEIPDELKSIAAKTLFTSAKDEPKEIEKRYFDRLKLARWTAGKVLRNNTVPLTRFFHDELFDIYAFANDPALAMENFRFLKAQYVESLPEVQDAWTVAEPSVEGAAAVE